MIASIVFPGELYERSELLCEKYEQCDTIRDCYECIEGVDVPYFYANMSGNVIIPVNALKEKVVVLRLVNYDGKLMCAKVSFNHLLEHS